MRKIFIYVLMMLTLTWSVSALTLYNVTLVSEESNITIFFDGIVTVGTVNITNESITLTSIQPSSCVINVGDYSWTTDNTIILSSSFASFFGCEGEGKYDQAISNIIILSVLLIIASMIIFPFLPKVYQEYYTWIVIAALVLIVIAMVI